MAQLPAKSNLTGGGVSEGGFRNSLDRVIDYLTGLFGADGTKAQARSTLGLKAAATRDVGTGADQLPSTAHADGRYPQSNARQIHVGTSEPSSAQTNDIWVDTN